MALYHDRFSEFRAALRLELEEDDDFKQIQAAIRADADLTKGGKRKRKQGNKASKTPERASPRGDGVGEEGVKRTAVGSLSPAPRDMNGVDRREA